jgi:hypothetical protein
MLVPLPCHDSGVVDYYYGYMTIVRYHLDTAIVISSRLSHMFCERCRPVRRASTIRPLWLTSAAKGVEVQRGAAVELPRVRAV